MKIYLRLIIFSIAIVLSSCKKDDLDIKEGTYKGIFTVTYSSGVQTGETTLELKDGRYICYGNSNRIPAGGSGTYSFDNGKITFNDENYWTAEFDWILILKGRYNYTFDGRKLKFSRENTNENYKYDLEKQ